MLISVSVYWRMLTYHAYFISASVCTSFDRSYTADLTIAEGQILINTLFYATFELVIIINVVLLSTAQSAAKLI